MKKAERRKWTMALFFLAAVAIGLYGLTASKYAVVIDPSMSECPIEFGKIECFESPFLPFFNPNSMDIEGIQVLVPKSNGIDIYNVNQPLQANTSEALKLQALQCPVTLKNGDLRVRWCCDGKCYESTLSNPSESINVTMNVTDGIGQANETYPEHPKSSDCMALNTSVKRFCFSDAAEISGNAAICDLIDESDIKAHCIARASMNESMCLDIKDIALMEGCIESIAMKRGWNNDTNTSG